MKIPGQFSTQINRPTVPNRTQGALGWIVVYGHTAVSQEQAEGLLPTEAIAERLGQFALAWDARQLVFGPEFEV